MNIPAPLQIADDTQQNRICSPSNRVPGMLLKKGSVVPPSGGIRGTGLLVGHKNFRIIVVANSA
jgi:hypothetical protein